LKFFKTEIERNLSSRGLRPERFEPKQLSQRRDVRFASAVLRLVKSLDGAVFVQGVAKPIGPVPTGNPDGLYGSIAQRTLQTFERFLRFKGGHQTGCGVIVLDRRDEARDLKLLASAQSHLFSTTGEVRFDRIAETPLLVRSDWYHGVQAADTVARVAALVFRFRETQEADLQDRVNKLQGLLQDVAWVNGRHSSVHVRKRPEPSPSSPRSPADPLSVPLMRPDQARLFRKTGG
jgi:hypothetical protein